MYWPSLETKVADVWTSQPRAPDKTNHSEMTLFKQSWGEASCSWWSTAADIGLTNKCHLADAFIQSALHSHKCIHSSAWVAAEGVVF